MSEGNKEKESGPASNNVIDFTIVKLERMANDFNAQGQHTLEQEVYIALDAYMSGSIGIVWQKGMPHAVTIPEQAEEKPNDSS